LSRIPARVKLVTIQSNSLLANKDVSRTHIMSLIAVTLQIESRVTLVALRHRGPEFEATDYPCWSDCCWDRRTTTSRAKSGDANLSIFLTNMYFIWRKYTNILTVCRYDSYAVLMTTSHTYIPSSTNNLSIKTTPPSNLPPPLSGTLHTHLSTQLIHTLLPPYFPYLIHTLTPPLHGPH